MLGEDNAIEIHGYRLFFWLWVITTIGYSYYHSELSLKLQFFDPFIARRNGCFVYTTHHTLWALRLQWSRMEINGMITYANSHRISDQT